MLYFDTCFLAPVIRPEATSTRVAEFLQGLSPAEFAASHWTRLEFASVVARDVRMGVLTTEAATRAAAQLDMLLRDSFTVFLPDAADFDLANEYLRRFETGLRAGDALHLAIAARRGASAIYTLDKALTAAGKILRLPVKNGIEV